MKFSKTVPFVLRTNLTNKYGMVTLDISLTFCLFWTEKRK